MAYQITYTNTFKKEYQRCKKRGYDMSLLRQAITIIKIAGNAICALTGCWCGNKTTKN